MVWEIPEKTLKPSDKRSSIYQYINIQRRIMIVNAPQDLKEYLAELLKEGGYLVDDETTNEIAQYYEGLIYFSINNMDKEEEGFIKDFALKLHSESSIVIVDYDTPKRNEIEKKIANQLRREIGLKINTLLLEIPKNRDIIINENEIAEDIVELLIKFKNTTGVAIATDGGKIEFDQNGRTKKLEIGEFYRVINHYFKKLNKKSYLWCASAMLEDEWTEKPQEMKFRVLNLEVANRGIKVERIFIFSKNKIKQYKNNKTLKIYMQSNIKTLFVDYDEIQQKRPDLLETLADRLGWSG